MANRRAPAPSLALPACSSFAILRIAHNTWVAQNGGTADSDAAPCMAIVGAWGKPKEARYSWGGRG